MNLWKGHHRPTLGLSLTLRRLSRVRLRSPKFWMETIGQSAWTAWGRADCREELNGTAWRARQLQGWGTGQPGAPSCRPQARTPSLEGLGPTCPSVDCTSFHITVLEDWESPKKHFFLSSFTSFWLKANAHSLNSRKLGKYKKSLNKEVSKSHPQLHLPEQSLLTFGCSANPLPL